MSRKKVGLILLVVTLGCAGSSFSQDELGVYFDPLGGATRYSTSIDGEEVTMYLTIVNPTSVGDIEDYVGTVKFVGEASTWSAVAVAGCTLSWAPPTAYEYCADPIETSSHVVVMEYSLIVPTPDTLVEVFLLLNQVEGPYYSVVGSDDIIPLAPVSGGFDIPVAVINEGTVSEEGHSWGGVKSSFK